MWLASTRPSASTGSSLLCTSALLGRATRLAGARGDRARGGHRGGRRRRPSSAGSPPAFRSANPDVARALRAMIAATPAEGYAACCEAIGAMDLRGDLRGDHRADARHRRAPGPGDAAAPRRADRRAHPRRAARDPRRRAPGQRRAPDAVTALILDHLEATMNDERAPRAGHERPPRGARRRARRPRDRERRPTLTAPFQDFITRSAWGDVWARAGLDRRTRSIVTLAALTALRAENEIAMHVRAALTTG